MKIPSWVWGWMVLFVLAGSAPFVIGWLAAPDDMTFTGVLLNVNDTNAYYADMQLGLHGRWLYVVPSNPQASKPVPLYMVYILLGHLARLTGLSVPLVFHLARLTCAALFVPVSYRFIARHFARSAEQRFALAVLLFTGGVGWLMFILFGSAAVNDHAELTPDIWIADAVSFTAILSNVHFILNIMLMLWMIEAGEAFVARGAKRDAAQTILSGMGIAFIHAPQLAVTGLVLGGSLGVRIWKNRLVNWGEVRRLFVSLLPGGAITVVLMLLVQSDPYLKSWQAQNDTPTPPVYSLFILYGPVLILAWIGVWSIIRARQGLWAGVAIWFVVVLLLIYVPVNFQRRFMEGWHVPVALLAAAGWFNRVVPWLRQRFSRRAAQRAQVVLLTILMFSPLFAFTGLLTRVLWSHDAFAFVNQETQNAVRWIDTYATPDDVVLTGYDNGNRLAARAGVRVFVGHWAQTAFVDQREEDVRRFFNASTPDADRVALLKQFNVSYVYVAEEERALGDFVPEEADYLTPVYTSPSVTVFRVQLAEP